MYLKIFLLTLLIIILLIGVFYGVGFLNRRKKLPNNLIKLLKLIFKTYIIPHYGPLSIGIFEGTSIFNLREPLVIENPVIKAEDVNDMDARFVADPFIIKKDGMYYMFFEIMDWKSGLGKIGCAVSRDGYRWNYKKVVVDESFHLSYPYIFEYENNMYMVPESKTNFSVRLYKATNYPAGWKHIGNLLEGYSFYDSSLFQYDNLWWMFTGIGEQNDTLKLYYSDNLFEGWTSHPMNPIVKQNPHFARPGGRVIVTNDKIYRLAQDCYPRYGIQLFAFEITLLSPNKYEEQLVSEYPLMKGTGKGWNANAMHHLDLMRNGDNWLAAADGEQKSPIPLRIYSLLSSRFS